MINGEIVEALEDAILDLVRLGLSGEGPSIERYANRLLRRAGARPEADKFRRALSEILVAHASTQAISPRDARSIRRDSGDVTYVEHLPEQTAPILGARLGAAIERLLEERLEVAALEEAGVEPTRSVLLVGPPGVGKTMTARYIAHRLDVPLVALDLVTVMSSMLGQSGQNIRKAIEFARAQPCVFFLDEIDAIAKRRDDVTDVGELKRIVNLLLLELDRWPSTSLLIAATNHPELLDRAIWRRFDQVVELSPPDEDTRKRLLVAGLTKHAKDVSPAVVDFVSRATPGASGADLALMVRSAVREAVLSRGALGEVLKQAALAQLSQRVENEEVSRELFCRLASDELAMTHREIGALIGVSHVTVGNILKSSKRAKVRSKRKTTPKGDKSQKKGS